MRLKLKRLHPDAQAPAYATPGAACFDLCAVLDAPVVVLPGQPKVIRTGLAVEVPEGWVMRIHSRSGQGFKHDTRLANCTGIIDSDYRGEVVVKLASDGPEALVVNPGDRIAQAELAEVVRVDFQFVDELSITDRGTGGFGSTGFGSTD